MGTATESGRSFHLMLVYFSGYIGGIRWVFLRRRRMAQVVGGSSSLWKKSTGPRVEKNGRLLCHLSSPKSPGFLSQRSSQTVADFNAADCFQIFANIWSLILFAAQDLIFDSSAEDGASLGFLVKLFHSSDRSTRLQCPLST